MPFACLRVSNSRWRLPLMTCGLLCLLATAACSDNRAPLAQTPRGTSPPRTQFPMPPTTTAAESSGKANSFTLTDNRRMRLSDYAGFVVVLDFYATWCPPCRQETPQLIELHKRYEAQGLRIIGLNVGGSEDRDQVPIFISEFQIPYALGFPEPEMANLYLSDDNSIPQAFVFDRQGKLVKRFINYDSTMPVELESIIKTQLGVN